MKTIVLFVLGLTLSFNLFSQTEIKVPELKGNVVLLSVQGDYIKSTFFYIEDGEGVSVKLEAKHDKGDGYISHLHSVSNTIKQILDQNYRFVNVADKIHYFIKE